MTVVASPKQLALVLGCVREMRFAVPLRLNYLCGLRLSECLHVEVKEIQRAGMRLHVREAKGGKD